MIIFLNTGQGLPRRINMRRLFLLVIIAACTLVNCASAQPQIECNEVTYSDQQKFWSSKIRGNKSIDLKTKFSFVINGKDFFCTKTNGLVYLFDMGQEKVIENRFTSLNDGHTEPTDYYVDKNVIAWRKRHGKAMAQDSVFILKYYDYKTNIGKEKVFVLPKGTLKQASPVIIDTNRILIGRVIFYNDKQTPDTLNIQERKMEPRTEGRTFMRKNMYITDNCFEALERCSKELHGLSFTKIEGKRLVTYDLNPQNVSVPINTYRIEADYGSLILMSSKIDPNKFLLYHIHKHFAYPFELDKEIFNLNKLVAKEKPGTGNEEFAPNEVRFTYSCSMDEKNIYIGAVFKPGHNVKIYKVSNYEKLVR